MVKFSPNLRRRMPVRGFTLVEVLVTLVVLTLLLVIVLAIVTGVSGIWGRTREKIQQLHQGREAFEMITRRLSEATLNPYYDYVDVNGQVRTPANAGTFIPATYNRQSELRFISGPTGTLGLPGSDVRPTHAVFFQAPLGIAADAAYQPLPGLLNTCGYFIEYGSDEAYVPPVLGSAFAKRRFRLMEMIEPSESLEIYKHSSGNAFYNGHEWFSVPAAGSGNVVPVADNIIALVLLPKLSRSDQGSSYTDASLAPGYLYDSTVGKTDPVLNSKNQLPPEVDVTMVVLDEITANRMDNQEHEALLAMLRGLFLNPGDVLNASSPGYAQDLAVLCNYLDEKKFRYRVFTSTVILQGAKWSRNQRN